MPAYMPDGWYYNKSSRIWELQYVFDFCMQRTGNKNGALHVFNMKTVFNWPGSSSIVQNGEVLAHSAAEARPGSAAVHSR